jgi:hypothetical protein
MLIRSVPTLHLKERRSATLPDAPVVLRREGWRRPTRTKGWFGKARNVHAAQDVTLEIRAARRWASSASRARARAPWRAASCA